MNDPWSVGEPSVPARRGGVSRTLLSLLILAGAAVAVHHFDPVGRASYAVMRGKLKAEKEYLSSVNPEHAAQLDQISKAFHLVSEVIKPSVVSIRSLSKRGMPDDDTHSELKLDLPRMASNVGSGVIFDEQGLIVTSNHVVADADDVTVELADGRSFGAKIVGTDPMTDLAVLKINASKLHAASFGDSDAVDVGHVVLAVGSPFRLSQTVSHGIVSAKGRKDVGLNIDYQDFIQTDCPINPGNSGGPLVNARGQVIGINTAIATDSGSFSGIGFATPSNKVVTIANELKSGRKIVRGYLGVAIAPLNEAMAKELGLDDTDGVLIPEVAEDGPAGKGGLKAGDVVLKIDGKTIRKLNDLQELIAATAPGTKRTFLVWRDKARKELKIEVGRQPRNFSTRGGLRRFRPPVEDDDIVKGDKPKESPSKGTYVSTLGVDVVPVTKGFLKQYELREEDVDQGLAIIHVDPVSVARESELKAGMVILSVARQPVRSIVDLRRLLTPEALSEGVRMRIVDRKGVRNILVQSKTDEP